MTEIMIEFNKALPYKVLVSLLNSDLPGVIWNSNKAVIDISTCAKALKVKALRLKNYLIYLNQIGLINLEKAEGSAWVLSVKPLKNYIK
jgi:hypothetical protein